MNVIKSLTARIEDYRTTNAKPCKNYATEEAAERATQTMAASAAVYFTIGGSSNPKALNSARYVVFFVPGWNRWVGCIDLTELMQRSSSTGGYLGFCKGFYTY